MNRHILCTVGTSLLTNPDRPWAGWTCGQPLPSPDQVLQWARSADPERASAEINSLHALELDDSDRLDLLHSATPEGRLCAEVLRKLYQPPRLRDARIHEIRALGYGAEVFTRGLKGLVDLAIRLIREAGREGREPILCATGGFKAEIALLNLLGALLGVEVVYIHEHHRSLVRLPRLPLRWDDDVVTQHEDFFRWIDAEPRRSTEVETWLKGSPHLRTLVEDDGEGYTFLSAAGDLLYKAAKQSRATEPRATWPEPDPRPPDEKNHLAAVEHHRPPGWERFVDRLCRIDCVSSVRYDRAARGGPRIGVLDPGSGAIALRFGPAGNELPLRVETTARGQAQCELVAQYLARLR
jgi:putative CRISPR-associated protein (TIGR02619 family)